jgi:Cdc6-like AAA superfamily ATPase
MIPDTSHLHDSVVDLVTVPEAERIAFIEQDRWIDHPVAMAIRRYLDDLLSYPRVIRPPCLLLHGDAGVGKTAILGQFLDQNTSGQFDDRAGCFQAPIVSIQMSPGPETRKLYQAILYRIGVPIGQPTMAALEHRVIHFLGKSGARMIVIDEVQHLITGGPRQQRLMLNTIKHLSNALQVTIVCAGTREALPALSADQQVASRFQHIPMPR